jgi:hypothetical protein
MNGWRKRWKEEGAGLIFVATGWLGSFCALVLALTSKFGLSIITVALPASVGWFTMSALLVIWADLRAWVLPQRGRVSFVAAVVSSCLFTLGCIAARLMIAGINPVEYSLSEDLTSMTVLWLMWPFALLVAAVGTVGSLLGQVLEKVLGDYLDR